MSASAAGRVPSASTDSDDELEAALEAAMEHETSSHQDGDSDDELEAALAAAMESSDSASSSNRGNDDNLLARELQAEEYAKEMPPPSSPSSSCSPLARRSSASTSCWLLLLPEDILSRILSKVTIANLVVHVRVVNKFFVRTSIVEVRERVRGLLFDALVAGFETETATAVAAAGLKIHFGKTIFFPIILVVEVLLHLRMVQFVLQQSERNARHVRRW